MYLVPARRVMPANTSAASAICGTHFGLTNAETSITGVAGVAETVDERDLVGRRDRRGLVLESVARSDFDERDAGGQGHFLSEGLCPSDSPTRSLARRFAGALRSRGSLTALARSRDRHSDL